MDYKDYYKVLGIAKAATQKDIKAAYRKLARKHHPDMNPGNAKAEARFKEINEANEVLSDPEKRQRYDQLGANWKDYGPAPGARAGRGRVRVNASDFGAHGFSDFFETFFGGAQARGFPDMEEMLRGGRGPEAQGADLEREIDVSLDEVLRGGIRTLRTVAGESREVEVKIPPGIRDGARLRVAGEGSGGARRGDLYLRVRVVPHPSFVRHGDDLRVEVKAPLTTAVLGGEIQVPTLEAALGVKVPSGTPSGRVFRLKGHGLPRPGGGRGDLMAELVVVLPDSLTPRERELFEELRTLGR